MKEWLVFQVRKRLGGFVVFLINFWYNRLIEKENAKYDKIVQSFQKSQ